MAPIVRNDRCPGEIARKFKHCCGQDSSNPTTPEGFLVHRLNGRENHLFEGSLAWAKRGLGPGWLGDGLDDLGLDGLPEDLEDQLILPWLVYHHPVQGVPPVERYLAERGPRLMTEDRAILEAQQNAWLSIWEVTEVRPGVGVAVRDLLTNEERFVHEVRGSRSLERWAATLGYVADYPGVHAFAGIHPSPLGPVETHPVVQAARARLGVRTRPVPPAQMRAPDLAVALICDWRSAVHEQAARARVLPKLCNTDGDPLLLTKDRFGFSADRRDEILHQLEALEGAHRDEDEQRRAVITCSKPGNAMHSSWDNTTIARLEVARDAMVVETNSLARADAIRARIEEASGERLRHLGRETTDPAELMSRRKVRRDPEPRLAPPDPRAQEVVREFLDQHYESWIDEEIPALVGLTPREASRRPAARQRLVALLKEFERLEAKRPEGERYEVGKLWAALGLDPVESTA